MVPPVGKSGPFIKLFISLSVIFSFLINAIVASMTSPKLCGNIFVAIPTAIPPAPFTNRLGYLAGKTDGSYSDSS